MIANTYSTLDMFIRNARKICELFRGSGEEFIKE